MSRRTEGRVFLLRFALVGPLFRALRDQGHSTTVCANHSAGYTSAPLTRRGGIRNKHSIQAVHSLFPRPFSPSIPSTHFPWATLGIRPTLRYFNTVEAQDVSVHSFVAGLAASAGYPLASQHARLCCRPHIDFYQPGTIIQQSRCMCAQTAQCHCAGHDFGMR